VRVRAPTNERLRERWYARPRTHDLVKPRERERAKQSERVCIKKGGSDAAAIALRITLFHIINKKICFFCSCGILFLERERARALHER
jgi:hypothetical protein